MTEQPSTSRPRTARERARAEIRAELLAVARHHLATDGPANLSLRAIARDLGVASSAVYRYVESRDALLTLLIVEAYDAVGQTCEDALEAAARRGLDAGSCWLEVARAFRKWALEHPHQYALVYGTPVPGYAAPVETVGAAVRLWGVVARVLVAARMSGTLRPPQVLDAAGLLEPRVVEFATGILRGATTPDAYAASDRMDASEGRGGSDGADARDVNDGAGARDAGDGPPADGGGAAGAAPVSDVDLAVLEADVARSVTLFASLVGSVSAELFGHLHGLAREPDRVFDLTTATAALGVGLDVPLDAPVDTRLDTPPDAPPDTPPDAPPDAGPGAAPDAPVATRPRG
ncbi:TetR/AcrR family transcriptional regulator [Actinotalea ferrariae]|uniref:TetR/AcrR family transcriptional regulator n=1 Tax=Actinotalea ferrariae TaxID=1386098 RepID=UPI001C8B487A|nr:TetR/AcrR family transcriptional regulator [Actinotalea ferrariae]MBX9243920.1 TetR/AcrR family transcriptional regulator [Actinotalea ferrariae]